MELKELAAWLPHSGAMCLLDRVVCWDETGLEAQSERHRRHDHPLRGAGGLAALHAFEYGAQGVAAHGALLARAAGERIGGGYLAAGRDLRFYVERLDTLDGPLQVRVERQYVELGSRIYRFWLAAGAQPVAEGQAVVVSA